MTRLQRPPRLAVVESEETLYLAVIPEGPVHALDPVAAAIWWAAQEVDEEQLSGAIAAQFEAPEAAVGPHVRSLIEQTLAAALLVRPEQG